MKLSEAELNQLKNSFYDLINYESEDPDDPINPFAYIDSNGDSCLHIAAQRGDIGAVELLLKAGLDVNQQGDMGCTALHYAKMKNFEAIAELLLAYGANPNIKNEFGQLPKGK